MWIAVKVACTEGYVRARFEIARTSMYEANSNALKVFLCHGSEDKPTIRQLYDRLRDDGVIPWLDEQNILPGQDWDAEIRKAVKNSHAILVCLSSKSVNKEGYIQREIRFALDVADEKPDGTIFIIPVQLDICKIPERLKKVQYVEYSNEDGYEMIIRALRERARKLELPILPGDGMLRRLSDQIQIVAGNLLYKGTDIRERLRLFKDGILLERDVPKHPSNIAVGISFEALDEALRPFPNEQRQNEEKRLVLRLVGIETPCLEWREANNKVYCFRNEEELSRGVEMIERTPVSSSNIASVGYDSQREILEIAFHSRSIYRYFGVPEHLYEGLMNAASHGRYFDQFIKKAGYRYERMC